MSAAIAHPEDGSARGGSVIIALTLTFVAVFTQFTVIGYVAAVVAVVIIFDFINVGHTIILPNRSPDVNYRPPRIRTRGRAARS